MKKLFLLLFFAFALAQNETQAQCAMCSRVAETGHEAHDGKVGGGLNSGIIYLLSIPYVMGGIGIYVYFKKAKKN
jgi:hypothetical protein